MDGLFTFLFIFAQWLLPPISLIIAITNIFKYKYILKKSGENIVLKQTRKMPTIYIIILTIFTVATIIALIITKELIYVVPFVFSLYLLSTFIQIKIYSNINGLYKYGLIFNEFIAWDNIHSYKWINENTISFLLKTGNRLDFENVTNKERINALIIENNIIENNN